MDLGALSPGELGQCTRTRQDQNLGTFMEAGGRQIEGILRLGTRVTMLFWEVRNSGIEPTPEHDGANMRRSGGLNRQK
jgi:hypothetical protein